MSNFRHSTGSHMRDMPLPSKAAKVANISPLKGAHKFPATKFNFSLD